MTGNDTERMGDGGETLYRGDETTRGNSVSMAVHRNVDETETKRISMVVVEALAEARGVEPAELEDPLYESVDPDALDALFPGTEDTPTDGRLVFTASGYEVTVTAAQDVYVRPVE